MDPARLGAMTPGPQPHIPGALSGPLHGLRFAAKDLFDVAGFTTGAGNPDWARTHAPAERHADAVSAMLAAGATLVGKTQTDELAFSLNGENVHYGTPLNPRAPGRIPGGSSSGSASAVAGAAVDVALGTDTGGSVRIPASYCGLYGMRPSHGAISVAGLIPLAPRFDTVGWFARDCDELAKVGRVLLPAAQAVPITTLVLLQDCFALAEPEVEEALAATVSGLRRRMQVLSRELSPEPHSLAHWMAQFRILQGRDCWRTHGDWITSTQPTFGPGIRERFAWAASLTHEAESTAETERHRAVAVLGACLRPGTALLLPTAPGIAPRLGQSGEAVERFRGRALTLTAIAGLGGLPQITIPAGLVENCPVGLSLIGARGEDLALLDLAEVCDRIPRPANDRNNSRGREDAEPAA